MNRNETGQRVKMYVKSRIARVNSAVRNARKEVKFLRRIEREWRTELIEN